MPRHKKAKRGAAAPTASAKKTDWLVGDLVVAKLRGHRPWPAQIQKPEDYGYDARPHKIFVTFFGTEETCFCSYNKITPFTSAVRKNLAEQLQKVHTNLELERAIKEIFAADDELKVSAKVHNNRGGNQKDDEMASDKSSSDEEVEEPPAERSRKRSARVVEEAAAPAAVVDERPAKPEKTIKSMAAEQVQKLPRKVRIKVSNQTSDLPSESTSQAPQPEAPPLRTSDPVDSATVPVKITVTATDTTTDKADDHAGVDTVSPKVAGDGENAMAVDVEQVSIRQASENGADAVDKTQEEPEAVTGSAATAAAKAAADNDGVESMESDDKQAVPSKATGESTTIGVEEESDKKPPVASTTTATEPATSREDGSSAAASEAVTLVTADDGVLENTDNEKDLAAAASETIVSSKAVVVTGEGARELDDSSAAVPKESVVSDAGDERADKVDASSSTAAAPKEAVPSQAGDERAAAEHMEVDEPSASIAKESVTLQTEPHKGLENMEVDDDEKAKQATPELGQKKEQESSAAAAATVDDTVDTSKVVPSSVNTESSTAAPAVEREEASVTAEEETVGDSKEKASTDVKTTTEACTDVKASTEASTDVKTNTEASTDVKTSTEASTDVSLKTITEASTDVSLKTITEASSDVSLKTITEPSSRKGEDAVAAVDDSTTGGGGEKEASSNASPKSSSIAPADEKDSVLWAWFESPH